MQKMLLIFANKGIIVISNMKLHLMPLLVFCLVKTGFSASPPPDRAAVFNASGVGRVPDESGTCLPGFLNDFPYPLIRLENVKTAHGTWLRPPFPKNGLYQWKYEGGRLRRIPCMLKGWRSCLSGPGPGSSGDRSELEEALGDTLVMVKMTFPEAGAVYTFRYRGKTFHSLDEVRKSMGLLLIRYVVFSPDCSDGDQALVRAQLAEGTRFHVMDEMIGAELRPEKPVVLMEGGQVPVSFFVEWRPEARCRALD